MASRYFQDEDDPDLTDVALFADPRTSGFEYQTYGVWLTGLDGPHMPRHTAGAGTFGEVTPAAGREAVPATGSATYAGGVTGLYAVPTDDEQNPLHYYATTAILDATAHFGEGGRVEFETSGTTGIALGKTPDPAGDLSHLDLAGDLDFYHGNQFFGEVTTDGGMRGGAGGSFYGPGAVEIGGTFDVRGDGSIYIGSFGGRQ